MLERFKLRNAEFRRSSHDFPLAVDKLSGDHRISEAVRARAESLLRQILLLHAAATQLDYESVAAALQLLIAAQGNYPGPEGRLLNDFRATFEQAAVGIAHTDPDGRFLQVNQKLCDMLGYTRDELLAMTAIDVTRRRIAASTRTSSASDLSPARSRPMRWSGAACAKTAP